MILLLLMFSIFHTSIVNVLTVEWDTFYRLSTTDTATLLSTDPFAAFILLTSSLPKWANSPLGHSTPQRDARRITVSSCQKI